jgi:hypothetical protein
MSTSASIKDIRGREAASQVSNPSFELTTGAAVQYLSTP